jgi:thiol-disulfide isomerase/thioredoxin
MIKALLPLVAFAALAAAAPAQTLTVGKPAPPLTIAHFVQGEPVTGLSKDKVHVIEFWATWCGPCIKAFPHLSELQERHADDVVVIGVSDEPLETVRQFQQRPDIRKKARYRMATDPDRSMQRDWMVAAGRNGIPCTFIVDRQGIVRYIGHPLSMDATLDWVVQGKPGSPPTPRAMATAAQPFSASHSPAAKAWIERIPEPDALATGRQSFTQTLHILGQVIGGGAESGVSVRRTGTITRGAQLGTRIESTQTFKGPGMPTEARFEETVVAQPDGFLIERRSLSAIDRQAAGMQGVMHISREDARTLGEGLPAPTLAMFEMNPLLADPLAALRATLADTGLEIVSEDQQTIVLRGKGAPQLSLAGAMRPGSPPVLVQLELDARSAAPRKLVIGDPARPDFSIELGALEAAAELDQAGFAIGAEPYGDLAEAIRQRRASLPGR